MKEIQLTQGYIALVDECDYAYLSTYKWRIAVNKIRNTIKPVRSQPYTDALGIRKYKIIAMSHTIFRLPIDTDLFVLNVDGNYLNCTRNNLLIADASRKLRKTQSGTKQDKSSRFIGVTRDRKLWKAAIKTDSSIHLGYFDSEEMAALVYNCEAAKYGTYCKLNVLTDKDIEKIKGDTNPKRKKGYSTYKGVTCDRRTDHWYARIKVGKRTFYLGYFTDEVEAAKAYDKAALKHFGKYANINFKEKQVEKLLRLSTPIHLRE